ncbi:hypothetical protein EYF80_000597 [Liparis tanakae]|uniref:Uncharacterized protein n=1 Tax=Liparis tanakae TaxID=230148 RepID=A0A4Z2JGC0_9TELE|nr:hypothetical protein EYF80_000597 [Liparis tanakae]
MYAFSMPQILLFFHLSSDEAIQNRLEEIDHELDFSFLLVDHFVLVARHQAFVANGGFLVKYRTQNEEEWRPLRKNSDQQKLIEVLQLVGVGNFPIQRSVPLLRDPSGTTDLYGGGGLVPSGYSPLLLLPFHFSGFSLIAPARRCSCVAPLASPKPFLSGKWSAVCKGNEVGRTGPAFGGDALASFFPPLSSFIFQGTKVYWSSSLLSARSFSFEGSWLLLLGGDV